MQDGAGFPMLDSEDGEAPAKAVWPEMVGRLATEAKEEIQRENPNLLVGHAF